MKQLLYTVLIIMLFTNSKCTKDNTLTADNPYGLPNATQTGANMFACRINDKNFIGYSSLYYCTGATFRNDSLSICGEPKYSYLESLGFLIKSTISEGGTYDFNSPNNIATYITDSTCRGVSTTILQTRVFSGNLQILKLDRSNKIISGIFNCLIPISNCDTLKITNGRFDFKYN